MSGEMYECKEIVNIVNASRFSEFLSHAAFLYQLNLKSHLFLLLICTDMKQHLFFSDGLYSSPDIKY